MKQVHSQIGIFLANNSDELSIEKVGEEEIGNEHGYTSTVNVWRKKTEKDNSKGTSNFFKRTTMFMFMLVLVCSGEVVGQKLNLSLDPQTEKIGVISTKTGEWIIPPKYDEANANGVGGTAYNHGGRYDAGYAGWIIVRLKGKMGLVDSTGKEVVPPIYDYVYEFKECCAMVMLNHKYGFVDSTGKDIVSSKYYEYVESFRYGYARVSHSKEEGTRIFGPLDKTGKEIVPPIYDDVSCFYNGCIAVKSKNKWGFVDKTHKWVIPLIYDDVQSNAKGEENIVSNFVGVKLNGKWGLIDSSGKEIVSPKYDDIGDGIAHNTNGVNFKDGYAGIKLDGKWGLIDKTGKEVISPKYSRPIEDFVDGYAETNLNGVSIYIDKTGKTIDEKVVIVARAKAEEKRKQTLIKNTKHLLGTWKGIALDEDDSVLVSVEILRHDSCWFGVIINGKWEDAKAVDYEYISPTEILINYKGKNPCKIKGNTMIITLESRSNLHITLTKQTKSKSTKKKSKK